MIKELADRLWSGEASVRDHSPFSTAGDFEEIADGVAFFRWFGNFSAVKTDEGLVLIDTGSPPEIGDPVALLRRYSSARVHTAIYTHGHIDHVGGMTAFAAEARSNRSARPRIVAHHAIAERFDRYQRTAGYNAIINSRQFQRRVEWPTDLVHPDTTFDHQFSVVAGNHKFECHHARGETDDHCWIYLPIQKALFTGDFIIWAAPNAGNPSKIQRYAGEWAEALRAMAKTDAEILIPGHGLPVFGKPRVRQMLNDTADYLHSINEQTLKLLNDGAPLDTALREVKPPAALADKPYLQAIYDEPEFIVRNIYRLEGGWYDGIPSHLKPAAESELGGEICALAGGSAALVARAMGKFNAGNLALASHLIDWAYSAAPDDPAVNQARMQIYSTRAEQSQALMTRGIFRTAANESARRLGLAAE